MELETQLRSTVHAFLAITARLQACIAPRVLRCAAARMWTLQLASPADFQFVERLRLLPLLQRCASMPQEARGKGDEAELVVPGVHPATFETATTYVCVCVVACGGYWLAALVLALMLV